MQRFLEEISGARLPIATDDGPATPREVLVGDSAHLAALGVEIDWDALGEEGFTLRTVGETLVIAGSDVRGAMYGVYHLLEEYLGCRWFSATVSRIVFPQHMRFRDAVAPQPTIALPDIDDSQVPILEYREPFYWDAFDGDWAARNKANSRAARLEEHHGGKITYFPFVHSFTELVPSDEYFAEHPEYFSEINGQRVGNHSQLCMSSDGAVEAAVATVRRWIEANPDVNIVSVSQNDWGSYCTCEPCSALADAEGSWAAPLVVFVNRIAEAIEGDYPNVAIDTLAYQWSRKPPKTIRPRDNVIIRLCSIECCFAHPLDSCDYPQNVSFRDDIVGWSKLCDRLYIWDYVTSFSNYLTPFPNWDVLKPNIRFFADHGVKGIFEEGNYNSPGGELAELRAYVMAKLLWDPDYDADKAMDEFLEGYYGPAAEPIRDYVDMLTAKVRDENLHLVIWVGPNNAFLTDEIIERANHLFDVAERRTAGDPDLLLRVRTARLGVQHAELTKYKAPPESDWIVRDGLWGPRDHAGFDALADGFFDVVDAVGITNHREGAPNMGVFREAVMSKRGGLPVVTLDGDDISADVIAGAGARLAALRDSEGRNVAAGSGYTVSLSRSVTGRGAAEAFLPVAGAADTYAAELAGGLTLTRSFRAANGELRVVSGVTNTSAVPQDLILHVTMNLDLGPADANVLSADGGQMSIAIPEDRTTETFAIPSDLAQSFMLANGETKRGVRVTTEQDTTAFVTSSTGTTPTQVHFYVPVEALGPGASMELAQALIPQTVPDVPGAESPRDHAATRVEIQDDRFSLHMEGVLSEYAMDPTASDGWVVKQLGSDKEWSIQHVLDESLFDPDARYRVLADVRIDRKGDEGTALTFGVYDSVNAAYALNGSRSVADMPPDEWTTIDFGAFVPRQGMYIWTAPPLNGDNVEWVRVDRFILERVDE